MLNKAALCVYESGGESLSVAASNSLKIFLFSIDSAKISTTRSSR